MTRPTQRFLVFAALTMVGCADLGGDEGVRVTDDPDVRDGGSSPTDAGLSAPDLGSGSDMGMSPPSPGYSGIPALDADSVTAGGESSTDDSLNDIRTCYDGEDNDADDAVDCADPACFPVASCCVSSGRAACCTAPEVLADQSFDGCADPASCLDASVFGSPEPFVSAGALAMGGDSLYDSGLLLTEALDLRGERVRLQATFRDTTSCAGCLDGAAFGVTAQVSLDDQEHVEPLVALQRNAGGDVRLRVGPRTLHSFTVTEGEPFTLVLRPDGVGEVTHGGVTHSFVHAVGRVVHAVTWGYSSNPSASAPEGVFLDDFSLRRSRCGAADGWRDRAANPGADRGRLVGLGAATDASGTHWLVLDDMDGLAIGTIDEAGEFQALPVEIGTVSWGRDPRGWGLTHDGTDLWLTFLADLGELVALGRARWNGDTFVPEAAPFFEPPASIAHARWISDRGHELIVVGDDDGVALWGRGPDVPAADGVWTPLDSDLSALTEGVGQPDLHRSREGVWLLHVARPMGTRWVVELFASDELVAWRPMGIVLAGSGDLEDFDGLGASAPAVVTEGDALQLYYVGHGPAEQVLGGVRRWVGAAR